jgi:hypothetical protein
MKRQRVVFVLSLVIAALLGFGLGWWFGDHSENSLERRAHEAVRHVRDAYRSLTR